MSKTEMSRCDSLDDLQLDLEYVAKKNHDFIYFILLRQEGDNQLSKSGSQPLSKGNPDGHKSRSELSNRSWSRKFSPTRGEYLKMDDEVINEFKTL